MSVACSGYRAILTAGTVVLALFATTFAAYAESYSNWGGSSQWGGGRKAVSFPSKFKPDEIIVSFGDRRLYHVTKSGQAMSYPIAIPNQKSRWHGVTNVSMKKVNPPWRPTPTMIRENPRLPSWVPGGHPMNPLGVRALYLGSSTYRIHGTDAPWTIGKAVSKGCIRMFNKDVLHLYPRVDVGARVTVTWKRFKTAGYANAGFDKRRPRRRHRKSSYSFF